MGEWMYVCKGVWIFVYVCTNSMCFDYSILPVLLILTLLPSYVYSDSYINCIIEAIVVGVV